MKRKWNTGCLLQQERIVDHQTEEVSWFFINQKICKNFEHWGVIYEPWHTNCPECPEMYKMGEYWYLVYSRFSERAQTIYRYSKSPYGPWRTPKFDGIDNRRFYAAKSLIDNRGRRIYFAWTPEREKQSDDELWQTGGDFAIPHQPFRWETGTLK